MRPVALLLIAALLLAAVPLAAANPGRQSDDPYARQIAQIILTLTPEERVGQLMLVTFEGSNLSPDTPIAQLIAGYNLGGVMLLAENDNINGQVNTPRLVLSLTTALQELAYDNAQDTGESETALRAFVPLFVATAHTGNGQPATQIATGTTPLPSLMALGATWDPASARQVGEIAGQELAAMGINLLLGPPLDVAQPPSSDRTFDLGVDTFGGEPYWVGQMGRAYIAGVHTGSLGRIAVIAQHFPGLGFADSDPNERIPVVPRTVDQLEQGDLVPFMAVSSAESGSWGLADGFQCANIRYQGENIRSITRPTCLDEQAASQLLAPLGGWRANGLMISPPLGSRGIRRYYEFSPFPHRQVAREAFLAGNDMLYLAQFGPEPDAAELDNVIDVIRFFAGLYTDDPVFRARVDEALARVLRLKLELYGGDFSLANVQHPPTSIDAVGSASAGIYGVAQQSVTLLAPRRESLPPPPSRGDRIVIFTDVRLVQQCSYCAAYPLVSVNALEVAIERLYGPFADAQIRPEQVVSFSFSQLQAYLQGTGDDLSSDSSQFRTNQRIAEALHEVGWIVFVMLDVSPDVQTSSIVRHLLESDSSMVERARVAVFALDAPTYLTSTEISRFSAYFGLYSSIPPYIDAAARALFQESSYPGAPPISVPGVGYDIFEMTAPNPAQTLQLEVDAIDGEPASVTPSEALGLTVGRQLTLRTRPITDRNGHVVPDSTPVEFTINFVTDNLQTRQYGTTSAGVARLDFKPTRTGRVQITAASVNALRSTTFQIVVSGAPPNGSSDAGSDGSDASATGIAPAESGSSSGVSATGSPPAESAAPQLGALDLVVSLSLLALLSAGGFFAGRAITATGAGGIRVVLGGIVTGLTGYIYYGVHGPGAQVLTEALHGAAPPLTTLSAGLVGLLVSWALLRR